MGKGKGNSVWRSGHQKDKSRDGMSRHNQYTEALAFIYINNKKSE